MKTEELEFFRKLQQQVADKLIARGFAERCLVNDATGIGTIRWTESGRILHSSLRHLFGIPHVSPESVSPQEVASVIGLILVTDPTLKS